MALLKRPVQINFAQGLDQKTDPKQVTLGRFLSLENTIFDKYGLLQKRNGFAELASLPDESTKYLTTFKGGLTSIGKRLYAYSEGSETWIDRGAIQPVDIDVKTIVRNNTTQSQCDSAISSNGLVCTVFTDNEPSNGSTVASYKYTITNLETGQVVVAPRTIPVTSGTISGSPRVFFLGVYFIIVFTNTVSGTPNLQYVAINIWQPTSPGTNTVISTQYTPNSRVAFDGVVTGGTLYLAWNGSDGGGAIRMTRIDQLLTLYSTVVFAGYVATQMCVVADTTQSTPVIYAYFYDSGSSTARVIAVNQILSTVLAATTVFTATTALNLAAFAQDGILTFFYEVSNSYTYGSQPTNYIRQNTVTQAGTVGTASNLIRSLGIASKAFEKDGVIYLWGTYQSLYQNTYFLLNVSTGAIAKLAYQNGPGYLSLGLPQVAYYGGRHYMAYLYRATIQAVNKTQGAASSLGVYSQLGVNLVSFEIETDKISAAEIGNNLNISGGFIWAYDGAQITEQGFHLYPDNIGLTASNHINTTGDVSNGNNVIQNVASTAGVQIGMNISGSHIPASTTVTAITATTITMSNNATSTAAGITLTISGNMTAQQYFYQICYEWTDNQGNLFRSAPSVPQSVTLSGGNTIVTLNINTLRVTQKTASPVQIVIYRWSAAQQSYYQTTSITVPIQNSLTVDSVSYTDWKSDAQIIGNNLIYTTGGVVENIAAPATKVLSLFNQRLFALSAEDQNQVFYSKRVINATPVEMSDLFSIYIAPTISAQGNTGPIKAISSLDDKLILFKKDAIYYVTGAGPNDAGQQDDFSSPVFVTSTLGCENQASIVFIPQGLMFQATDEIWLLGRNLSTEYIGAPVEDFARSVVTSALTIPTNNQVRFTLASGRALMYDFYFAQWSSFENVAAISSTIFQELHTYVDQFGRVFQESPGVYKDGATPVVMSFRTGWASLGGLQGFERAYGFSLLGAFKSPHKLTIDVAYDYSDSYEDTYTISPDNYTPRWGGEPLWGDGSPWGGIGKVMQWSVSFSKQKCQTFSFRVSESFDPDYGTLPGEGLTLSGLDLVVGIKGSTPKLPASRQVG